MKKYFSYFYVILPLFFIGLYQQFQKIETNLPIKNIAMKNDFILFKVNDIEYGNLTKEILEEQLNNIHSIKEANDFLKNKLKSAKRAKNTAYAGFAIEVYMRLEKELQLAPELLSTYSALLSFTHQFEQSSIVLEKLSNHPKFYDAAVIRLLNISMLKGKIGNSDKLCKRTKTFENYRVFIACQIWIKGMKAEDNNQVKQFASQLLSLANIDKNNSAGSEFKSWLYQLSLDLYLKSGEIAEAHLLLNKLWPLLQTLSLNKNVDLAPLIQVLDYSIINEEFELASQLMNQYDIKKQLKIRRILIENNIKVNQSNNNGKNNKNYPLAKETIQSYILAQDASKYRLISLWNIFMENNQDEAVIFSKLNQITYTTFIDRQIDKAIENNFEHGKNI